MGPRPHHSLTKSNMYLLTAGNNIQRIRILEPGRLGRRPNYVCVCSILSPADEMKSQWGQIVYEVHKSTIFASHAKAKKESFIRKLAGK